jgi:hypothetical protein
VGSTLALVQPLYYERLVQLASTIFGTIKEQWIKTSHDKLEPPRGRIAPGRPKKQRRKATNESRDPKNPNQMRKFRPKMKCGKCHGLRHNKRACPLNKSEASNVSFFINES